jgi:hypothetical protein
LKFWQRRHIPGISPFRGAVFPSASRSGAKTNFPVRFGPARLHLLFHFISHDRGGDGHSRPLKDVPDERLRALVAIAGRKIDEEKRRRTSAM